MNEDVITFQIYFNMDIGKEIHPKVYQTFNEAVMAGKFPRNAAYEVLGLMQDMYELGFNRGYKQAASAYRFTETAKDRLLKGLAAGL